MLLRSDIGKEKKNMIRLNYEGCGYYYLKDTTTQDFIGRCEVRNFKDTYEIWNVRVFERFRQQGYATLMLKRIIKKFSDKPLILYVWKTNEIAIHLYEKLGFSIIGEYMQGDAWKMQYMGKHRKG